jgi:hypothetical protein
MTIMGEEPLSMDQFRATYDGWTILTDPHNGLHVAFWQNDDGTSRHVVADYTVAGLAGKLAKAADDDR